MCAMEQLFGSKTRVKLLRLFVSNPNRPYYVREITRKIDEQINSVRRELGNLLNIGILKSREESHKLYYEVDQSYVHYEALRAIFTNNTPASDSNSATETDKDTAAVVRDLGAVDILAYMGGFTGEDVSGVDVLIVGDVNRTKVHNFLAQLEKEEDRELRYAIMPTSEFEYRRDIKDRFVTIVDSTKKSVVHDPKDLMGEAKEESKKSKKKKSKKE